MNKEKEYLNEKQYQKSKKKVNSIGNVLLIVGGIMLVLGFVMVFGFRRLVFSIFPVFGLSFVGFGSIVKILGNAREINAFMTQQQMPIAKESAEKMAPTIGVVSKEITKGIKEGLKEEQKDNK